VGTSNSAPTASVGSQVNVLCFGASTGSASIAVSGGTSPYTYSWSPSGGSAATASSLAAGTYTVTVTDANSLSDTAVVTISQPNALASTLTSSTNVACFGTSTGAIDLSVSGGVGPFTYSWSGPSSFSATTQDLSGLAAGTYSVTVTDANGCTTPRTVTLAQPAAALSATATSTSTTGFGLSNGSATAIPSGGTAPYTYSWSPSGGTAATATGLAAGTYTVTVTDANGCSTQQSVTVAQPAPLIASNNAAAQVNVLCFGASTGSASIAVSGGTSPYTYSWSPSGGSAATASSLAAGTYTVTVTDSNNLSDTAVVIISEPTSAVTAATAVISDATCLSSTDGSAYVLPSGGVAPYTILWSNGSANDSIANLAPGTYSGTITDANGCNFTGAAVVISTTDADCDGILNVTEGSANPTPTDTDNDGTPDWLDPDSDNDCIPDSFELTVDTDNDGTGDWRDLDSDDDLIPDNVEAAGSCANPVDTDNDGTPDFRELDSDNDGIPDTDEAGSQPNNPVDTDGDGTPDYRDLDSDNDGIPDEVERGPDGANPVDTDGDGTPDYRDLDADGDGILDAQESSTDDCDNDGIPNAMDADVCEIWIPQGFSPNGDGFNDTWEVNYLQYAAQNTVTIVNRWGEVVYRRDQYDNSWDGTPNTRVSGTADDGRVPDGTYYYIFTDFTHNRQYTGYVFITK
jgi:gliding motility-associated-like protein